MSPSYLFFITYLRQGVFPTLMQKINKIKLKRTQKGIKPYISLHITTHAFTSDPEIDPTGEPITRITPF